MNEPLMRIVLEQALFLSLSETLDADVAVTQLEGIAAALQELPPADLLTFLRFVEAEAGRKDQPAARREALIDLPEAMGLVEHLRTLAEPG